MDSEDEVVVAVVATLLLSKAKQKNKRKRRYWVHPYNEISSTHGTFCVARELNKHPAKFQSFYRMSIETFTILCSIVGPSLRKKDTNFRMCLSIEEKLLITLRYLATGTAFRVLAFHFMRGETTVGKVIEVTTAAIWRCLKNQYMPLPSEDMWIEIAQRYEELWNMPNCIGSIDGKHVRIKAPPKSGSAFFNYKSYHSIVLMGIADADSLFTAISVGDFGRNSNGAVFKNSGLCKLLETNKLNIPPGRNLPGTAGFTFPMFFVADEAFALKKEIMKPYPQRSLDNPRRIFNYRLSRARKSIECAFGMLYSKFRVFERPIACNVDKADDIIKATCILHNFIRKHDGIYSTADVSLEISANCKPPSALSGRPTSEAIRLRNMLCEYFMNPEIALPWQNNVCI